MRFILILIVCIPLLMGARTLGLFRDWLVLRRWSLYGQPPGVLTEAAEAGLTADEAVAAAWHKLIQSALSTLAAVCFAVAAGLVTIDLLR